MPFALFSSKVPVDAKRAIVRQFKLYPEDWCNRNIKLRDFEGLETKWLEELIGTSSHPALRSLGFDLNFIFAKDSGEWNMWSEYKKATKIINSLKVVNDAAERSVALMSTYNESRTKSEAEMQRLLQVVEYKRHRIPNNPSKNVLKTYNLR